MKERSVDGGREASPPTREHYALSAFGYRRPAQLRAPNKPWGSPANDKLSLSMDMATHRRHAQWVRPTPALVYDYDVHSPCAPRLLAPSPSRPPSRADATGRLNELRHISQRRHLNPDDKQIMRETLRELSVAHRAYEPLRLDLPLGLDERRTLRLGTGSPSTPLHPIDRVEVERASLFEMRALRAAFDAGNLGAAELEVRLAEIEERIDFASIPPSSASKQHRGPRRSLTAEQRGDLAERINQNLPQRLLAVALRRWWHESAQAVVRLARTRAAQLRLIRVRAAIAQRRWRICAATRRRLVESVRSMRRLRRRARFQRSWVVWCARLAEMARAKALSVTLIKWQVGARRACRRAALVEELNLKQHRVRRSRAWKAWCAASQAHVAHHTLKLRLRAVRRELVWKAWCAAIHVHAAHAAALHQATQLSRRRALAGMLETWYVSTCVQLDHAERWAAALHRARQTALRITVGVLQRVARETWRVKSCAAKVSAARRSRKLAMATTCWRALRPETRRLRARARALDASARKGAAATRLQRRRRAFGEWRLRTISRSKLTGAISCWRVAALRWAAASEARARLQRRAAATRWRVALALGFGRWRDSHHEAVEGHRQITLAEKRRVFDALHSERKIICARASASVRASRVALRRRCRLLQLGLQAFRAHVRDSALVAQLGAWTRWEQWANRAGERRQAASALARAHKAARTIALWGAVSCWARQVPRATGNAAAEGATTPPTLAQGNNCMQDATALEERSPVPVEVPSATQAALPGLRAPHSVASVAPPLKATPSKASASPRFSLARARLLPTGVVANGGSPQRVCRLGHVAVASPGSHSPPIRGLLLAERPHGPCPRHSSARLRVASHRHRRAALMQIRTLEAGTCHR